MYRAKLNDPTNKVIDKWKRPNGLIIKKVSTPIGVIGVIYESRPNVTSDVASLCFKSGNVVILRGGSEAYNSNKILVNFFVMCSPPKKNITIFLSFSKSQIMNVWIIFHPPFKAALP